MTGPSATPSTGRIVPTVALVAMLVVGALLPAGAAGPRDFVGRSDVGTAAGPSGVAAPDANDTRVNVTVGSQLSTVVSVTSETVRSDVEETEFDLEYETADGSERAEILAERAETLAERADDLREDHRAATRARERGELTREEYAHRLAVLNARARALRDSYAELRARSANVSGVELSAAGLNVTALERTVDGLDNHTGAGLTALMERFVAERDGRVSVETADGVEVTVESEDGERAREFERPGDGNRSITVAQLTALETARTALSDRNGRWALRRSSVHELEGTYRFRFWLVANDTTGEAEVTVDGSSGEVVELESEVDAQDGGLENGSESEGAEDDITLAVVAGTPAPSATVTLQALADGEPVPDATVRVNDAVVGTTGANGTLTLTLPDERVDVEVEAGDADGELRFEFDDGSGEDDETATSTEENG